MLITIIAHHKEEPVAETRKTPFGGATAAAETFSIFFENLNF